MAEVRVRCWLQPLEKTMTYSLVVLLLLPRSVLSYSYPLANLEEVLLSVFLDKGLFNYC